MSSDYGFTRSISKRQIHIFAAAVIVIAIGSFLVGYGLCLHKEKTVPTAAMESQDGVICDIQPAFMPGVKKIKLLRSSVTKNCSLSGLGRDMEFYQLKQAQHESGQNFVARVAKALKSSVPGQDLSGPTAFAFTVSSELFYRSGGGVLQTRFPSNAYNLPWVLAEDSVGTGSALKSLPGTLRVGTSFIDETGHSYAENLPEKIIDSITTSHNMKLISNHIGIIIPVSEPLRNKILGDVPSYEHYQFGSFSPEQATAFERNLYMLFSVTPDLTNPIVLERPENINDDDIEYAQFEGLRMKPGGNWALVRSDTEEVIASGTL